MKDTVTIFWFRRDLRLDDNVGFYNALKSEYPVLPIFIFDEDILEKIPKDDARLSFIHETVQKMNTTLEEKNNSSIAMFHGKPAAIYTQLIEKYNIHTVFTNRDYEPYAKERDTEIEQLLSENNIKFETFKDQVIFEKNEVTKKDGLPYVVYTPYMKVWKEKFKTYTLDFYYTSSFLKNLVQNKRQPNLSLSDIGFSKSNQKIEPYTVTPALIQNYEDTRNFPAQDSTSKLGPHLRFGTVSVRKMIEKAISEKNEIFWQELIWREFFMQILWHFPHTAKSSFKANF